jgi:hypothetical protein
MGGSSVDGRFACPRGCMFTFGGILKRKTFRAWKKHMDEKHGGATAEELEAVNAILSDDSAATKSREQLETEASQGEPQLDADGKPIPPAEASQEARERKETQSRESKRLNKEINEKMAATQHLIFEKIPRAMFDALASTNQSDTFRLSENESKMIEDSLNVAMLGMGINWEIEPWNVTIKSPLWLLMYPLAVLAFVFIGKKRTVDAERASMEPQPPATEQVQ